MNDWGKPLVCIPIKVRREGDYRSIGATRISLLFCGGEEPCVRDYSNFSFTFFLHSYKLAGGTVLLADKDISAWDGC